MKQRRVMFLVCLGEQEISQIRAKADIVDVTGRYMPLIRKGRSYKYVYPFHNDHGPSMSITADKQIYECFVCGTGDNVFMFVQNYEKISFIETVYKIAEYAGVTLEHTLDIAPRIKDPHLQALHKACQEVIKFTHYQLGASGAKDTKGYLTRRNIMGEVIERLGIGYNPMDDALCRFLHTKRRADDDLVSAGLVRVTSLGVKDVFLHRIIIPIHDGFGEPVGFIVRRAMKNEEAKYISAMGMDIYKKGDLVFNYHGTKQEARKAKKAYLMESTTDVLTLGKAELHNTVVTLRTAMTRERLCLLRLLHVPVAVCYDGDKVGRNTTYKFSRMARRAQLPFKIVNNKYGLDPDEVIGVYGKDELRVLLDKTIPWTDFLLECLLERYSLDSYSRGKELAREVTLEIRVLRDDFEKQSYLAHLREPTEFDTQVEQPKEKHRVIHQPQPPRQNFLTFPESKKSHAGHETLSQVLGGIATGSLFKEELGFLEGDTDNKLAIYIIDCYQVHITLIVTELLDVIREEDVKALLLGITNWKLTRGDVDMAVPQEAIAKKRSRFLDSKIQLLNRKIRSVDDPVEKTKLTMKKDQLIKECGEWHSAGRK